jgi:hypothetical protein
VALDVDSVVVGGIWLRHVPHGSPPDGRPPIVPDGRWQRGTVVDALYLAGDDDCMWSEWYRHLAESGIPPLRALPRDVWRFAVADTEVADLSTEERLKAVGLAVPPPGRRTCPPYQTVGEQLHSEGWLGLLAPSAARPKSRVLCIFIDLGEPFPADVTPQPPPEVVDEPPVVPTGLRT